MNVVRQNSTVKSSLRIRRMVFGRDFTVHVTEGMQLRLRAFSERVYAQGDRPDGDDDHELVIALLACAARGLEVSEHDAGLRGTDWGEFFPLAQDAS